MNERFDYDAARKAYEGVPEFVELEREVTDAFEMVTSHDAEKGLEGQALVDYWDNIGLGDDGFYDSIRRDGCSSCGSHTPGCCDGCA